jgi:hypothetical protein
MEIGFPVQILPVGEKRGHIVNDNGNKEMDDQVPRCCLN